MVNRVRLLVEARELSATRAATAALARLEDAGALAPKCRKCRAMYRDAERRVRVAAALLIDTNYRPPTWHTPSLECVNGRRPHCTCDRCAERFLPPATAGASV